MVTFKEIDKSSVVASKANTFGAIIPKVKSESPSKIKIVRVGRYYTKSSLVILSITSIPHKYLFRTRRLAKKFFASNASRILRSERQLLAIFGNPCPSCYSANLTT